MVSSGQISNLCAEEAAAQEQTGQVEECLKVNLLKIKTEICKKVRSLPSRSQLSSLACTRRFRSRVQCWSYRCDQLSTIHRPALCPPRVISVLLSPCCQLSVLPHPHV